MFHNLIDTIVKIKPRIIDRNTGVTLVEVMIAVGIFAFGIIPIFMTFSETRRVTIRSSNELKATSMASSMIAALMRTPAHLIEPVTANQKLLPMRWYDEEELPTIGLGNIGTPPPYPKLKRRVMFNLVNYPKLPEYRFKGPWGKVVEIKVSVYKAPEEESGKIQNVFELNCYREIVEEP